MHLQKQREQPLPGLVAGDMTSHPSIPEVNVSQEPLGSVLVPSSLPADG